MLLFSSVKSIAQEWQVISTKDFNFYYKPETKKFVEPLSSQFLQSLKSIQTKLNYHVNQSVDIFLVAGVVPKHLYPLANPEPPASGHLALDQRKILISTNSSIDDINKRFLYSMSQILIDEMMYGGTLQDKIKSANLINLPTWVLPGLNNYLAYDWSPEVDNALRTIFDEGNLEHFNNIPQKFDVIKGASFWKYVDSKYGKDVIPKFLYTARVARKFNVAMSYTFETSLKELFEDWKQFYTIAYELDQLKPNPIDGHLLSVESIHDLLVVTDSVFYTLENKWLGYTLYKNVVGKSRTKLYRLTTYESPLPEFSGSIYLDKFYNPTVAVNSTKGSHLIKINEETSAVKKYSLGIDYVNLVKSSGGKIFIVSSDILESRISYYDKNDLVQEIDVSGFVRSIDVSENMLIYSVDKFGEDQSHTIDLYSGIQNILFSAESDLRQLLFANDSLVLFNSDKNGIWNGYLLNINSGKVSNLTNYRSNILYHQYTNGLFVEYLNQGENSAIYITNNLTTEDFFTYDTISSSFFSDLNIEIENSQSQVSLLERDSLLSYTFQSPVHPNLDFTTSDFDSLSSLIDNSNITRKNENLVKEYFSPSDAFFIITNQPPQGHIVAFKENYDELLPNKLNLTIGGSLSNQYKTQKLSFQFLGFLQPHALDVGLNYQNSKWRNIQLDLLYRKRLNFFGNERSKFITTNIELSHNKIYTRWLHLSNAVSYRNDNELTLIQSEENLQLPNKQKGLITYESKLQFQNTTSIHDLEASVTLSPNYSVTSHQGSLTSILSVKYKYTVGPRFFASSSLVAGTSQGSSPIFFMLGGISNDLTAVDGARPFSNYKEPTLYYNYYGIRGFNVNHRNGNTFGAFSMEGNIKVIDYLYKRPIVSEVFSNLFLVPFVDMGTAFYGSSAYGPNNVLNVRQINSSTGALKAQVRAFKNPFVVSLGAGIATQIYGYKLRLDFASGYEDQKFQRGIFYLGLGKTL